MDGEHLLLALGPTRRPCPDRLFTDVGADLDRLRGELEADLARRPGLTGPGTAPARWSSPGACSRLLDTAEAEAGRLNDEYVSVEHLLVALLDESAGTGRSAGGSGTDERQVP